jgi:hypothetical protein
MTDEKKEEARLSVLKKQCCSWSSTDEGENKSNSSIEDSDLNGEELDKALTSLVLSTTRKLDSTGDLTELSKSSCYQCQKLGHLANQCSIKSKDDFKTKVAEVETMVKEGFDLLRKEKGKALVSEEKDWEESIVEEVSRDVNLALMASSTDSNNSQVYSQPSLLTSVLDESKVVESLISENKNLSDTLRSTVKETERMKILNEKLFKRNILLESKLAKFPHLEAELNRKKELLNCVIEKEKWTSTQLKEEQEKIMKWNKFIRKLDNQPDDKKKNLKSGDCQEKQSV